jgi:hypothetical protein
VSVSTFADAFITPEEWAQEVINKIPNRVFDFAFIRDLMGSDA